MLDLLPFARGVMENSDLPGAYDKDIRNGIDSRSNTSAPTMKAESAGPASTINASSLGSLANNARDQQLAAIAQLRSRSLGQAPSAAELQMNRGLAQAMAAQRSNAASARGMNPALAQRMAAQGIASAQGDIAGQAASLRAAEQAQAEQALVGALSGLRGQDINVSDIGAGYAQDANKFNAAALNNMGQFNAGLAQEAGARNLAAGVDTNAQNNDILAKLIGMGMQGEQAQATNNTARSAQYMDALINQARNQTEIARETIAGDNAMRAQRMAQEYENDNYLRNYLGDIGKAGLSGGLSGLGQYLASLSGKK